MNLPFALIKTPTHLALKKMGDNPFGLPLVVDFLSGALGYRLQHKQQKELLAKAIGLKGTDKLSVIDATAGLGRDGFILATLGCSVCLLERSELLAALLADGLTRALADKRYQNLSIRLHPVDAKIYLQQLTAQDYPDVIFIDPMFPQRQKSALVKREMRYLQALVGDDNDSAELLAIALKRAKKRVVVKRPVTSTPVANLSPHHAVIGKNIRFDIYMCTSPSH